MNNPIIQFSGILKFTYLALSDENKGRIQKEKEVKAAQLAIFKGILKGLFAQNFTQFECFSGIMDQKSEFFFNSYRSKVRKIKLSARPQGPKHGHQQAWTTRARPIF